MPVHPIYIPLLPKDAQEVIGKVHEQTRPARRMLESEGFNYNQMIDIFEAGPILHCRRDQIRSVNESQRATIEQIVDGIEGDERWIVSNTNHEFRVVQCHLDIQNETVQIERVTAETLEVSLGDEIRFVSSKK